MKKKILLIAYDKEAASLVKDSLVKNLDVEIDIIDDASSTTKKLSEEAHSLVVVYACPKKEKESIKIFKEAKSKKTPPPFVLIVDQDKEKFARSAIKEGIYDYFVKTANFLEEIPRFLKRVLRILELEEEREKLSNEASDKENLIREFNRRLEELNIKDELTGTYNHRYFHERLTEEFVRTQRYHHPVACLMVDIDFLKLINREYGYHVGDATLREMVDILQKLLRQTDVIARYGGEEFTILMPETSYEGAKAMAKRIQEKVEDHYFLKETMPIKLSVSIGITSYPEDKVIHKDQFIEFAERALLKAKSSGRNQICLYNDIVKAFDQSFPTFRIDENKLADVRNRIYEISADIKRKHIGAINAMVTALEAKDPSTREHSHMVAHYSLKMAEKMGFSKKETEIIENAALLHDIGKICIDDKILFKPSKLTGEEYAKVKEHAVLGYKILEPIIYLREELLLILYHHEWYNGKGYPHGLKKDEIPLGARVIGAVDAFVTMLDTSRLYRHTLSYKQTVAELIRCAGTQFDPKAVKALTEVLLDDGVLKPEEYDKAKLDEIIEKSE